MKFLKQCTLIIVAAISVFLFTVCQKDKEETKVEYNVKNLEDVFDYIANEKFIPPSDFDKKNSGTVYGTLTEKSYNSTTTGVSRKCYIYTPPNYDPSVSYPVLYLLHGIGGTHTEWLDGAPNEILSNLIAAKLVPPMIAVMPNIRAKKNDTDMSDMFGLEHIAAFDNFINDLRDNLMPFINENYLVSENRNDCAIAGLSMGGREALFIGVSMSDVFGYVGAFSPAPGLMPGQLTADKMTFPDKYKSNTLVLICSGKQDNVVGDNPLNYNQTFTDNGMRTAYYTINGGHDFSVWKNGLYYFTKCIFDKHLTRNGV